MQDISYKTSLKNSDQNVSHLVTLFEDVYLIYKIVAFNSLIIRDTNELNHYIKYPIIFKKCQKSLYTCINEPTNYLLFKLYTGM